MMEGYTEDKRVVLISDLRKDWELEDYYNMISDGFKAEGKVKSVFTITKKLDRNYSSTPTTPSLRSVAQTVDAFTSSPSVSSMGSSTTPKARRLLTCMADTCWIRATGRVRTGRPST